MKKNNLINLQFTDNKIVINLDYNNKFPTNLHQYGNMRQLNNRVIKSSCLLLISFESKVEPLTIIMLSFIKLKENWIQPHLGVNMGWAG